MKKTVLAAGLAFCVLSAFAGTTNSAAEAETQYTAAIENRAADILKVLSLTDTNQAARVHEAIVAQYRALRAWHVENDAQLKAAKADTNAVAPLCASLKSLHEKFLARLGENLSPGQIEQVKDKMTYGKVPFTFSGYLAQYPHLSGENQAEILRLLTQAREEAMDGGSAEEKTAIFQRYKGRINNYLSKQGVHAEKKTAASKVETNAPVK